MLVVAGFALTASGAEDSARPPAYDWYELEKLGGRVAAPIGWHCRRIRVIDGVGFQITKEEVTDKSSEAQVEFANQHSHWDVWDMTRLSMSTYRTGFSIKVIAGTFWTQNRLAKLADDMIEDAARGGLATAVVEHDSGAYATRRFERDGVVIAGDVMEGQHFVELILLDVEKPTLFLVTFDCPRREWPKDKDLCDKLLSSLTLFQVPGDQSHTPYPMPRSVKPLSETPLPQSSDANPQ
jgi:hypothetical protein